MKISLKIFVFTYCVVMFFSLCGGFFLVNYLYNQELDRAMETAKNNNQYTYSYIASVEGIPDQSIVQYSMAGYTQRMRETGENQVFVGNYEAWKAKVVLEGYDNLEDGEVVTSIISIDNQRVVQTTCRCKEQYIITYYDLSPIFEHREHNFAFYRKIILIISFSFAFVMYFFSWYVTRPLTKVTQAAKKISDGDYSVRVRADEKNLKSYDVMLLGETLNSLAEHTEKHIKLLEDESRKMGDFVGNFTHELKTPLTSIIGYADLLRTYDLEPEQKREYSTFIYNEGKRLEQLSTNMLQMISVDKYEGTKSLLSADSFFSEIEATAKFLESKYGTEITYEYDAADLQVEATFLVTAVLNLIDNACKASEKNGIIQVTGKLLPGKTMDGKRYELCVRDNGRGIPKEEISRVTEPFYMVDKSRARKQGGAGLGLALCKLVAELHDSELMISSELGVGTTITFSVSVNENDAQEGGEL